MIFKIYMISESGIRIQIQDSGFRFRIRVQVQVQVQVQDLHDSGLTC